MKVSAAGRSFLLAVVAATSISFGQAGDSTKVDFSAFKESPAEFRGTRWFTYAMPNMNDEWVKTQIDQTLEGAYGGWMATPDAGRGFGAGPRGARGATTIPATAPVLPAASYLNEEFFRVYRVAIEEGLKKHLPLTFMYDEQQFPSGFAGGLFRQKYPDLIGRGLEKIEKEIAGPANVEVAAPIDNGIFIGAVRMNMETLECVDISSSRAGEKDAISCEIPAGKWKVMLFYLDGNANRRGLVDYLDPRVDGLIQVMHQQYYDHLKEYFGSVIKMTFFDEPAMHHPDFKGRLWTPIFNQEFQKKYGYSPMKYYPALWYDIGPETAAARNALFGFRAEMYATNFVGRIAKWDADHGVKSGGHLDQEEAINPTTVQGDLMKVFKYQQVPGHDDIWFTGRSTVSYKIVTSSAFNWDKPIAMAETYAAYRQQNEKLCYRTAMDQHAFGINLQVGNYLRGTNALEFGEYLGRTQYLLQHGRHVADVAVLYPIAALQADCRFATPVKVGNRPTADADFYYALQGGTVSPEIDYMQLGEMLFRGFHIDYTWLHPEIIDEKCLIQDKKLILDNKENREEFRVLVIPGGDTINLAVAKKVKAFFDAGGMVIGTSKLPTKSAEFGHDAEVQQIMDAVFGMPLREPMTAEVRSNTDEFKNWFCHTNEAGGKAMFLPRLDTTALADALDQTDPVRDVSFYEPKLTDLSGKPIRQAPTWPLKSVQNYDGAFTYIHKLKDGHDIYFFANSFDTPMETKVVLRGSKKLVVWDPNTGEKKDAEIIPGPDDTTSVHLSLDPVKSTFYVSE